MLLYCICVCSDIQLAYLSSRDKQKWLLPPWFSHPSVELMWKWSGVTVRPGAGASVKSNRQWSVSGLSVPVTREERNVRCGRCNLQCRWHCLKRKYTGKRKAEVNFSGGYQSWRAPWIVTESSVGSKIACKCVPVVWEEAEGLFFSLCLILPQFPEVYCW